MKYLLLIFISILTFSALAQNNSDHSLTVKEYEAAGFPSVNMDWGATEISNAIVALTVIKGKQPLALPKLNSVRSGACFKKLMSSLDITYNTGAKASFKEKSTIIARLIVPNQKLGMLYCIDQANIIYYNREAASIYNLCMINIDAIMNDLNEFNKTQITLTEQQKTASSQVSYGYWEALKGIVAEMGRVAIYIKSDLESLSEIVCVSLSKYSDFLDKSQQTSLKIELIRTKDKSVSVSEQSNLLASLSFLTKI